MTANLIPLPIDSIIPDIQTSVQEGLDVIIKSSPGSGKTTRIPPALLSAVSGQIWVLEPRRIAARMSAIRVAAELNEKPGATVGWHMRLDRQFSDETRILFITEGMFTARLAQNPNLDGVDCIILDEFHERHLQTDVALALSRHLQSTSRPDLRIVIMSATLDTASLAQILPLAKTITLELPLFPVTVKHDFFDPALPITERAHMAALSLAQDKIHSGHILVFLPGIREILKTKRLLEHSLDLNEWILLELRGTLDKKTQELAFQATHKRKIILATNIAESSITIPDVTAVVDTGVAKVSSLDPFTGLSLLETRPISKASMIQRSGRAGRTAPGIALRLFSTHDEIARQDVDTPEVLRLDLSQIYMSILWLGFLQQKPLTPHTLPWPDLPEQKKWDEAKELLKRLKIIDDSLKLLRPDIARLPLHPRLACFAVSCVEDGLKSEAPWLTALLATPQNLAVPPGDQSHLGCDLLARFEHLKSTRNFSADIEKTAQQTAKYLELNHLVALDDCRSAHELDLSIALLRAFPDRVVLTRRQSKNSKWIEGTICTGGDLLISATSAAAHGQWIVAIEANSSRATGSVSIAGEQSSSQKIVVSQASIISPKLLLDLKSEFLNTETQMDQNSAKMRYLKKIRYGILTISESFFGHQDADSTNLAFDPQKILRQTMQMQWPQPFDDSQFFDEYLIRQKLAFEKQMLDHCWDYEELKELLIAFICDSASSSNEVNSQSLEQWLRQCIGEAEFQQMESLVPRETIVGNQHRVRIHYAPNSSPWIEARLQNFFGQSKSPTILNDTLPLTIHLLAPNMRALQVTTDLASFWSGTYKELRNQYQRKYPRHFWPEDPIKASPPVARQRSTKK
jgi:ATP-dependent helicase HrpB